MLSVSQSYKNNIYAPIRQFDARVTITLLGTTTTYYDDKIIRMNILEEMSTLNDTIPSNELQITMDNSDGEFNLLNFQNMLQIIASKPKIIVELGLVISETVTEWVKMGTYFLSDWKNEITNKTVVMTANDYFNMFGDISYDPTTSTNLKTLASEVLTKGGVPVVDQVIDDSLSSITVNPFIERLDCRTALQHIGIAACSAVFQDRNGKVNIKPFVAIDASSNYTSYTSIQNSLYHYPSAGMYALNNTEGGMKYIDFEQMYDMPEVTLDKSVYQVVVNVYDEVGNKTERVYTNSSIAGVNGQSFTIDNPLININLLADKVAAWYIRESNYNAIYKANWRQNPALECADMVLVEDSFNAEKQTRVFKQEFNYEGYLSGITESRGGI
jgi:hypothetical protein